MFLAEISLPNPSALALLAVALLVSGFLLFRTQRYFARAARTGAGQAPGAPHPAEALTPPHEAVRWQVEMHELAREVSARLDNKVRILEHLIQDADRAAARLESALDQVRPHTEPAAAPRAAAARGALETNPAAASTSQTSRSEKAPETRRHEEIYTLADYGHAPAEIARRLNLPQGEIELILSLRKERS